MKLNELPIGQKAVIDSIQGNGSLRHRLLEMGLLKKTPVEIIRFAPMGDPIDIKVRGYHLSLRIHEAEAILVTPLSQ